MVDLHDPSHKLRRTEVRPDLGMYVRIRVVHQDLDESSLLFAEGRIVDQAIIERSELLDGILQTEGETLIPVAAADFKQWMCWQQNVCVHSASPPTPQRLLELLQVATFLIDDDMAADVSAALARSLRLAVRTGLFGSWALQSLPAVYTDWKQEIHTKIQPVLEVLSSMKNHTLADVLQHMHLSELLHCPVSFQEVAMEAQVQQGCGMLSKQLAWHPRSRGGCPLTDASYLSKYSQQIQEMKAKQLDLSANSISETDVPLLATIMANLPAVQSLDLRDNPIDDPSGAFCDLLKQCMQRDLLHVKLPAAVLSTAPENVVLDTFACMRKLMTLDISGSVLTERMCTDFVSCLKHMSSLEHLGLWGAMLWGQGGTRSSTMVIADRPRDRQTGVPLCSMHEHVDRVFQKLPELTSLEIGPTSAHLRNAGVTDAVFMSLSSLSKLQSLRICARHVGCNSMYTSLGQLAHLSHLKVSSCPSLGGLLRPLRHCSSLSVLHAQRCLCRTLSNGALAGLTHLSELHLDLAATTEDALHSITWQLQAIPRLRHLDAEVYRNARWQHDWSATLHSLAPPALHALPALTALELPPCAGSELPALAGALRALPALRQLSLLRRNRELPLQPKLLEAEPHALQELTAAVATLQRLEVLELPFTSMHACASAAAAALAPLTALTRMALAVAEAGTVVAADVAEELGTTIARLRGLCELSLQFPGSLIDNLMPLVPYLNKLEKLQWLEIEGLPLIGPGEYSDVLWDNLKALPLHRGILLH